VFPHSITLLVLQDIGIVATEWIAWKWSCQLWERASLPTRWFQWVAAVVLFANPWWWRAAVYFDFHFQALAAGALLFALWRFWLGDNRTGYLGALIVALTGNVSDTYLVGAGVSLLLADRGRRSRGWIVIVGSLLVFGLSMHLGVNLGAALGKQTTTGAGRVIDTILGHPITVLDHLWEHRRNLYANLAPEGMVGLFDPWVWPSALVVLLENALPSNTLFSVPGFQSLTVYGLAAVGVVAVAIRLTGWRSWAGGALLLLVASVTFAWAVVWLPASVGGQMVSDNVSSGAAKVLAMIESRIPQDAEVVASQGVIGRFAGRRAFSLFSPQIPIVTHTVVFVVSPFAGIDQVSTATELSRLAAISRLPGIQLLVQGAGVWAFKWVPPLGHPLLSLTAPSQLPGWAALDAVGSASTYGPSTNWYAGTDSISPGYVVDHLYWRLQRGTYQVRIVLASTGPVWCELWNATANRLLRRVIVPATLGKRVVDIRFGVTNEVPLKLRDGWGPFVVSPVPSAFHDDSFELRVWTPGKEVVTVYAVSLR
jgi:hypothetical protein